MFTAERESGVEQSARPFFDRRTGPAHVLSCAGTGCRLVPASAHANDFSSNAIPSISEPKASPTFGEHALIFIEHDCVENAAPIS